MTRLRVGRAAGIASGGLSTQVRSRWGGSRTFGNTGWQVSIQSLCYDTCPAVLPSSLWPQMVLQLPLSLWHFMPGHLCKQGMLQGGASKLEPTWNLETMSKCFFMSVPRTWLMAQVRPMRTVSGDDFACIPHATALPPSSTAMHNCWMQHQYGEVVLAPLPCVFNFSSVLQDGCHCR